MLQHLAWLYWRYLIPAPKSEPHRTAYLSKLEVSSSVYGAIYGMSLFFSLLVVVVLYFTLFNQLPSNTKLIIYVLAFFLINPALATLIHLVVKQVNATL